MRKTIECDTEKGSLIAIAYGVSTAILLIRRNGIVPGQFGLFIRPASLSRFAGNSRAGFSLVPLFVLTAMLLFAGVIAGEEPICINLAGSSIVLGC
jgi:hypothetical protein